MEELIEKLERIDFINLDIDELLDNRDIAPFDSEWMRVYNEIEKIKIEKEYTIENEKYHSDISERVFIKVYELSGDGDLAGYISDDFGMIADSKLLGYSDIWLNKLIASYENLEIPSKTINL